MFIRVPGFIGSACVSQRRRLSSFMSNMPPANELREATRVRFGPRVPPIGELVTSGADCRAAATWVSGTSFPSAPTTSIMWQVAHRPLAYANACPAGEFGSVGALGCSAIALAQAAYRFSSTAMTEKRIPACHVPHSSAHWPS
ncbi:MAG: hypothetical protein U0470_01910 [Anaerolineae bacterium]